MMHAKMNGMTYLRHRRDSLTVPPAEFFDFSAEAAACISCSSRSACFVVRERSRAAYAESFLPRASSQRGDSASRKLPITNRIPGGRETQKMPRQAEFLK